MANGKWTTIATVPSTSNPNKAYAIKRSAEGQVGCTCPSYIFSGKGGALRSCKHLVALVAVLGAR